MGDALRITMRVISLSIKIFSSRTFLAHVAQRSRLAEMPGLASSRLAAAIFKLIFVTLDVTQRDEEGLLHLAGVVLTVHKFDRVTRQVRFDCWLERRLLEKCGRTVT